MRWWTWPWKRVRYLNGHAAQAAADAVNEQQQVVRQEMAPAADRMERVVRRGQRELDRLAIDVTRALRTPRP